MKKTFSKKILFIFILCLLLNVSFSVSYSKEAQIINSTKNNIEQQSDIKKQYEYLIQDTENFRQFIQQERKEHQDFLENLYTKICWALGLLITLFIGICSFFGVKTFKDIKQQVENEIKSKAKIAIDIANEEIESHLSLLNEKIENELSYKNANIFVFDKSNNVNIRNAMDVFKRKGIKHIKITDNINEFDSKFCLVICSIDSQSNNTNDATNQAKILINYMNDKSLNIPIIFYTADRIDPEVLTSCPYYCVPANTTTTLIMHCFTLLKMFC